MLIQGVWVSWGTSLYTHEHIYTTQPITYMKESKHILNLLTTGAPFSTLLHAIIDAFVRIEILGSVVGGAIGMETMALRCALIDFVIIFRRIEMKLTHRK